MIFQKRAIRSNDAPPPGGSYSSGIRSAGLVFVSGQTPRDRDRQIVEGDFSQQAQQTFDNLIAVARAGGASPTSALAVTVYLRDFADFSDMDTAFSAAFPEPRPARTTVQSNLAVAIEVDGVFGISEDE